MAEGLLDKANIILTPTGYKAGTMYNVAPIEQPYEDFVFSRASVASRVNSSGLVEMVGRTLGSNLVQNGDFSEIGPDLVQNGTFDLGSELVTNGDFATDSDWTKGTGWTIANGIATYDGTAGTSAITQADVIEVGKTYKVTIEVIENTLNGNGASLSSSGGFGSVSLSNVVGTHTEYITASNDAATYALKIGVSGTATTGTIKIDNVSVKEVPDWTLGTGWSVEDNKAYFDNSTGTEITQSLSTTSNSYKINFDLDLQSGSCRVYFNSPGISTQITLNSSGNKTAYITTTTNHTKFTIAGTGGSEFNITNVVVQELDPNDYWILGTGWSLGDGKAVRVASSSTDLVQVSVFPNLTSIYKITFDVVRSAGSVRLRAGTFNLPYVGATDTYTYYVTPTSNDQLKFQADSSFVGSIDNVSVQEIIDTNNIPRINYDSNGENGHWLLEPTSTNLITYSQDFSQSAWTKSNLSLLSNNIISPDGTLNASKLTVTSTGALLETSQSLSLGDTFTVSAFVKEGTNKFVRLAYSSSSQTGAWFNLEDKTVGTVNSTSASIENYGNGWYRIISTFDSHVASGGLFLGLSNTDGATGDSVTGHTVYVWGFQVEQQSYSTSYIPTLTGSTETRATETANGAGSADLINSTEGVLYAEIAALANSGYFRIISLSDGTNDNRVRINYTTVSEQIQARVVVGGVTQAEINEYGFSNITYFTKIAFAYKENEVKLYINGTLIGTDTSASMASANTFDTLNFDGSISNDFYGKCKELAVFGEALSDDELEKLTSWSSFNAMATDLGYTIE